MELRQSMQDLAQHQNFTESLPYSSLIFAETLKKWTTVNPVDFKKKERKILRSALKYLTRISTKTSPFGTFTTLQLVDNQGNNVESEARLKQANIKLLDAIGAYMISDENIRLYLDVQLNPSWVLYKKSNEFVFIQNENNEEVLQVVEQDSVVLFFMEVFAENKRLTFSDLADLVDFLDKEYTIDFLMDMFEVGIIVWALPFEKNFDGFQQAKRFLSTIPTISDEILTLLALLEKIEKSKDINLDFSFLYNDTDAGYVDFDYFKNRKEEQYYLDASSNFSDLGKKNLDFIPFYEKIGELFELLQTVVQPLQSDYLDLFIKNNLLKEKKQELSLTEFYQKILHHEEPENSSSHYLNVSGVILEFVEANCVLNDANEVHISSDFLKNLANHIATVFPKNKKEKGKILPRLHQEELASYNLVLQPYLENGVQKAILNGASIGFGKQFGRFLPLFDKKASNAFVEKIKQHNVVLAELDDASFFNGNIHQKLHENSICASSHQYKSSQKINFNELVIKKIGNNWFLWHSAKQEIIVPIDMGIEHPDYRSPFLQLLNQFSYKVADFRLVSKFINFGFDAMPLLPRVIIDNCLVIQRKTWFFDIKQMPSLEKNELESVFFIEINQWKEEKKLPNCVFVSIPPDQNFDTEDNNTTAQPQRDDYKPQYIDFENVLLVSLFARLLKKVPRSLKIEEMLPDESALWQLEGKKYMVESVVQFDVEK